MAKSKWSQVKEKLKTVGKWYRYGLNVLAKALFNLLKNFRTVGGRSRKRKNSDV